MLGLLWGGGYLDFRVEDGPVMLVELKGVFVSVLNLDPAIAVC